MHPETFLQYFVLLPLISFVTSILMPPGNEKLISRVSFSTTGLHFLMAQAFIILWLLTGGAPLNQKEMVLFRTSGYEFFLDFYFDRVTAAFLFVGSFLTLLVTVYSRFYLHRERGYKRFFNTIHFFFLGYNVVIFSGNMETLFVGWEILGISSFLLIAFYRERYLPVKNAIRVFSIYRIGDVGIILAMWLSHHLWHENITFHKLNNYELVHQQLHSHTLVGIFISLMILVAAAVKSAQLPFSSWLPRAMEGPTPSSAIFYGSLSVHLGVFLLMRTFPFWEHQLSVRIAIGILGVVTSIVATGIARVQSSVKSQIAYASVSQIGIIFIEMALGLEALALVHFAGNAFLRTYQLLVSPSVVTYLIREQFYHFKSREHSVEDSLPKRLEYTLYVLCLKEWNLDFVLHQYLWAPLRSIGKQIEFVSLRTLLWYLIPLFLVAAGFLMTKSVVPTILHDIAPTPIALTGLLVVLKGFVERRSARLTWTTVVMSHFWIALAVSYNDEFTLYHTFYYLSGIAVSGAMGISILNVMKRRKMSTDLSNFHGYSWNRPVLAFMFLVACLGVAGFPITPSFIGEDLIFTHIREDQVALAIMVALNLIIDGLVIIRLYARLFLGPVDPDLSRSY
jgi:NADH-quinone oxidoreductase subunit L